MAKRIKYANSLIRDIKRKTRRRFSSEEKIRIVLDGLRGEESIAALCRREGIEGNDEQSRQVFDEYIRRLKESGTDQLPLKKQRVIKLLKSLLGKHSKEKEVKTDRKVLFANMLELLNYDDGEYSINLDQLGQELIRYFQPHLQELRTNKPRSVITLQSLQKPFLTNQTPNQILEDLLESPPVVRSIDRRVVACIIGVKGSERS